LQLLSSLKRSKIWIALLAITLFFLLYSPALNGPFVFDDRPQVLENPTVLSGHGLPNPAFWLKINNRPITLSSLRLDYIIYGLNPFGFRLSSMLIHLLNTLLFLVLLRKFHSISKWELPEDLPWFGALIFLFHPLLSEGFLYIAQRGTILSTTFYLLSLWLYLQSKTKHYLYVFPAILTALFAVYSKQTAFSLFLVIGTLEFFILGKTSMKRKVLTLSTLAIVSIVAIAFYLRYYERTYADMSGFDYLMLQIAFFPKYVQLMLLPYPLVIDHEFDNSMRVLSFAFGFASLAILILVLIRAKYRWLQFALSLLLLGNIIVLSVLALPDLFVEHRMYLPMMGFIMLFLWFTRKLKRRKMLLFLWLGILLPLGLLRAFDWSSEIELYQQTTEHSPKNPRAWANLSSAYLKQNQSQKAFEAATIAVQLDSSHYVALNNLGAAEVILGKYDSAIDHLQWALKYGPESPKTLNNLGVAFMKTGQDRMAFRHFKNSLELNSRQFDAWYNLGLLSQNAGRLRDSQRAYKKALSINPRSWKARHNLVLIHLGRGNSSRVKQLLRSNPREELSEWWNDLGAAYIIEYQVDSAIFAFEHSLEIEPSNEIALRNIERLVTLSE
jgi:tetratricopeptide (TPR) repeat protein